MHVFWSDTGDAAKSTAENADMFAAAASFIHASTSIIRRPIVATIAVMSSPLSSAASSDD